MKKISKYFFNGLIVIVPIAITIFVVMEIFSFTEGVLGKHIPISFPGIGLITVLGLILLVGWLSSYWILQKFIEYGEVFLNRIPFVKFVYNSVKHLSTAVFESNNLFKETVLVPYPHQGAKALGFVMSELTEPMTKHLPEGEEYVCVFVPWSLNMTSGTNLILSKKDVIYLNISSEAALQYILTAGTVMPEGEIHIVNEENAIKHEKIS